MVKLFSIKTFNIVFSTTTTTTKKSSCILLLLFIPFTNFSGTVKLRGSSSSVAVAMKMLQPVQPGPGASQSAQLAWQGAQGKWARDPLQYSSKAYCTARQELNILLALRHPNIVPLVGESKMCRNEERKTAQFSKSNCKIQLCQR